MSKPPDRVKYTNLLPLKGDFEEIQKLGIESGILKGTASFEDYADPSFAQNQTDAPALRLGRDRHAHETHEPGLRRAPTWRCLRR